MLQAELATAQQQQDASLRALQNERSATEEHVRKVGDQTAFPAACTTFGVQQQQQLSWLHPKQQAPKFKPPGCPYWDVPIYLCAWLLPEEQNQTKVSPLLAHVPALPLLTGVLSLCS